MSRPLLESLEPRLLCSGVTLITHGYEPFSTARPSWIDAMGAAIAARAGSDTATYILRIGLDSSKNATVLSFTEPTNANPASPAKPRGEVIFLLDWAAASQSLLNANADTAAVARLVTPYLETPLASYGNHALAESPIHLLGHSRGASLVSCIAGNLARDGLWVDQVTTFDPAPVWPDPAVALTTNIVFADNYYQTHDSPSGSPVSGAYNLGPLALGGAYGALDGNGHSDTHLFYHGTIDTSATANDSNYTVPVSWYPNNGVGRSAIGFTWSRLAAQPRPADGLGTPFGGTGARSSPNSPIGSQWPNVGTIAPQLSMLSLGQAVNIAYRYQDLDSSASIQWFLDPDLNPYNANDAYDASTATLASTGASVTAATASFTPAGLAAGSYWLGARISDGTHTRIAYAPNPLSFRAGAIGYVDTLTTGLVGGWAFNAANPAAITSVRITIDNIPYADIPANTTRPDLGTYIASPFHGFNYALPQLAAGIHTIRVDTIEGANSVTIGSGSIAVPSTFFWESYYLGSYQDVAAAVRAGTIGSGYDHFLAYGQREGRLPSPYYSESYYLANNADVAAAVQAGSFRSGWEHFASYGAREGRRATPRFLETFYLATYSDVAAAVHASQYGSGYEHYVLFGAREGRLGAPA